MGQKRNDELFSKLLKLFSRGVQVTCQSQIHRSDLVFEPQYLSQIHRYYLIFGLECSKYSNSNIQLEI